MFETLLHALLSAWEWLTPWTVIQDYERGVLLRLGRLRRELDPGLHFIIPFGVDLVLSDNVVPTTTRLPPQSLTTSDGQGVVLSAVVTWAIRDATKFLVGVEGRETVLADSVCGFVAAEVVKATWQEIKSPRFSESLYMQIRKKAFGYGVEVRAVVFSDLAQCQSLRLFRDSYEYEP